MVDGDGDVWNADALLKRAEELERQSHILLGAAKMCRLLATELQGAASGSNPDNQDKHAESKGEGQ